MVNSTLIYLVFTDDSIGIWDFLTLSDALTLSTTNNFFAGTIRFRFIMCNFIITNKYL